MSVPFRLMTYSLFIFILIGAMTAIAATNTVPSTRMTSQSRSISSNDFKPAACASINLTNLVTGSGTLTGTTGNDLMLGSSGQDTIDGLGGNDCILGGGGIDLITGGNGTDVCIGGSEIDLFFTCETQIQ